MFSHLIRPSDASPVGVAFTDREGGFSVGSLASLNLGRTDVDDPALLERNGRAVSDELGLDTLVALHQVHGTEVLTVDRAFLAGWGPTHWLGETAGLPPLPVADAAVTALPGVALMIRVADCVPVLLADPDAGVVGGAHAGRVGFDQGVLAATVEAMRGLGATAITAWIGPHVCGDCYEVPSAMADDVESRNPGTAATTRWGSPSLDLGIGCERQLLRLGVRVERRDPCTLTTSSLHSHRRDGAGAGRQAGIIWRVS
ncbi:polyphenol oxidase family protein [Luteococcus sp. H138]|uniref:polyphenol oxidase family protein n=1 Tax=unclassified Luteococcus TaxID=2639923 RepID=UPI00313B4A2A